ncbi:SemiSWEET family sugar transporter [Zavarzinia sp. CC-PAN008]|uniref:SemiSWEET family sugar transporter n=1 Tax=Zavarzinia sp. CC-PAN008 TaxID=3243332 RepID=UPI003F749391
MEAIDLIGGAAGLLSVISFIPQVRKAWKERETKDLSLKMYLVTVTAFALWLAYGIALGSVPMALANGASLALSAAVLVAKLRFG